MEFPLIELMLVNAPVFCSCLCAGITCVGICMLTRYGERGTSWTLFGVVRIIYPGCYTYVRFLLACDS